MLIPTFASVDKMLKSDHLNETILQYFPVVLFFFNNCLVFSKQPFGIVTLSQNQLRAVNNERVKHRLLDGVPRLFGSRLSHSGHTTNGPAVMFSSFLCGQYPCTISRFRLWHLKALDGGTSFRLHVVIVQCR